MRYWIGKLPWFIISRSPDSYGDLSGEVLFGDAEKSPYGNEVIEVAGFHKDGEWRFEQEKATNWRFIRTECGNLREATDEEAAMIMFEVRP